MCTIFITGQWEPIVEQATHAAFPAVCTASCTRGFQTTSGAAIPMQTNSAPEGYLCACHYTYLTQYALP